MTIGTSFTAEITKEPKSGWNCAIWPGSVAILGTGKPVKVVAAIDGHEGQITLMPIGGMHMVPLRAATLKAIGKGLGDTVAVEIRERL